MNFSLRTMLLAVPVLAIGVSAFVFQLRWATSLIYTVTITALLLAIVPALLLRGDRRAYWAGFAVLGWGYWWLAFESPPPPANWNTPSTIPVYALGGLDYLSTPRTSQAPPPAYRFITSDVLDFFERHITPAKRAGSRVMSKWGSAYYPSTILSGDEVQGFLVQWEDGTAPTRVAGNQIQPYPQGFSHVAGHSLFCLLFAVAGGAMAAWLLRARPHDTKPASANAARE